MVMPSHRSSPSSLGQRTRLRCALSIALSGSLKLCKSLMTNFIEEEIAKHVAWMWGEDPQTLVWAAVKGASPSEAFVADVVTLDKVYERLVFCRQLSSIAAWVPAAPKEEQVMKLFTVRPQSFSLNGAQYVSRARRVEDGDVF